MSKIDVIEHKINRILFEVIDYDNGEMECRERISPILKELRLYVELAELVVAGDIIDTKRYRLYINRRMKKLINKIKEQK